VGAASPFFCLLWGRQIVIEVHEVCQRGRACTSVGFLFPELLHWRVHESACIVRACCVCVQVWDFPGDFDFARDELVYGGQVVSPQVAFAGASALVYVVDAQVAPRGGRIGGLRLLFQTVVEGTNMSCAYETLSLVT